VEFSLFPSEPIPCIETGMHTGTVFSIAVDRNERYLVSGSEDKTVRVWDLYSGRLLRTLRVPQAEGNVGVILSVGITPDGAHVAAGGWTGIREYERSIYIFDRETGEISNVIGGVNYVVHHLVYSPDGRYLAATLGGEYGLRVYETNNYTLEARDAKHEVNCLRADFDRAGRLVTTWSDGFIRLYDKRFRPVRRKRAPSGVAFSAVFSPDRRRIAIGSYTATGVDVLSSRTLEKIFSEVPPSLKLQDFRLFDETQFLRCPIVAWSEDGRFLYANSAGYDRKGCCPVRRWGPYRRWWESGKEKKWACDYRRLKHDKVMDLKPLSKGLLVMGTKDPLLAVLYPNSDPVWQKRAEVANFRKQLGESGIRLSENGDTVQFGYEVGGERQVRFSLKNFQLETELPPNESLHLPLTEAPGLKITDWMNNGQPKCNGHDLFKKIYVNDTSCSLAVAPDHKHFLIGTGFCVRLFDAAGKQIWRVIAPGAAWTVNISTDGKLAVAGLNDGTIRWYGMTDGRELLALFPHLDAKRWVVWTPQGYYNASAGAESLIGFHINNGSDKAPDFFGVSRFRELFYRPDVVARVLETLDVEMALATSDETRGTKTVPVQLESILPPTIRILSPASGEKTKSNTLTLFYQAESSTGVITNVEPRVDGRPAAVRDHQHDHQITGKREVRTGNLTVEIPPKDAVISVIAVNQHGSSEPAIFRSNWEGIPDWYKPSLYVLAVGVSDYRFKDLNLKYAHKDALDFVDSIKEQEGGLYKKVTFKLLISGDGVEYASKEAILDGLDWLARETTSRDVAMVFLSGHGTADSRGNYYFLPFDADTSRLVRTCIDKNDFIKYLSDLSGKTVLFFDTCRSGSIRVGARTINQMPNVDKFANELADSGSGVIVFSSSTGRQFSFEKDELKHGAFTTALLEGIAGKADYRPEGFVSIAGLEAYISDRVKELTKGEQTPVSAKPEAVPDFRIFQVIRPSAEGK
jgi:WD40 repeat protein